MICTQPVSEFLRRNKSPIGKIQITHVPPPDQLASAVAKQTAVQSLREVRERRLPLRVSLNIALDSEMRVLPMDEPMLAQLEALGFRRAVLRKADYPKLEFDVPTLDFSGFSVYTPANVPDSIVTAVCAALEARKEKIIWQDPALSRSQACAATRRQDRSTSHCTPPPNDSDASEAT
jgi:hypothetical protein